MSVQLVAETTHNTHNRKKFHNPGGIFFTDIRLFRYIAYIPAHLKRLLSALFLQPECHSTIDIITPPHHRVFRSTSLSRTLYSYTSHTFPSPLTSHRIRVQVWHTLRPMYNTKSHPFHHSWARDRLCSCAFMPLRSTHHTRMGQFPFHSYHCQTL